jgi:transposase
MEKTDARKLSPEAQEVIRKRAIILLNRGKKEREVCEIFGVSRVALHKWKVKYKKGGVAALNKIQQGRPKQSGKLKGWQASWVVRTITDKCPDQLKLPWGLWTRECVKELIKWKFDIELSTSSVSRLLKKWGFTPQKPIRRAYERNPKVVSKWMMETYPKIHAQAKKQGAVIHWGDEMGVKNTDQVGRSFSRRGKTPVIPNTTKRFKCNMISTVTNTGTSRFMIFEDSFTIDVFLNFLRKLTYKQDQKIFLILDNHRVHHGKKTKKWLAKYTDKIELFFLPPYAPELNPDELLNQTIKQRLKHRPISRNQKQFKRTISSCVKSLQKSSGIIKRFFDKAELAYISAA